MVQYKHIKGYLYEKLYPNEGSYDMGMLCNQQNKKRG